MSILAIHQGERARMRRMASIGLCIVALQRKYSFRKRTKFINVLLSRRSNIHQRFANSSSARPTVAMQGAEVQGAKVQGAEVRGAKGKVLQGEVLQGEVLSPKRCVDSCC